MPALIPLLLRLVPVLAGAALVAGLVWLWSARASALEDARALRDQMAQQEATWLARAAAADATRRALAGLLEDAQRRAQRTRSARAAIAAAPAGGCVGPAVRALVGELRTRAAAGDRGAADGGAGAADLPAGARAAGAR